MVGIPQGSILAPTLYNIFTSDIPHFDDTFIATFAAILSLPTQTSISPLNDILWSLWRIKINETKSSRITFTLSSVNSNPLSINNNVIPKQDNVKYLGIHLVKKFNLAYHIKSKRKSLNFRFHTLRHVLRSKLPLRTKILIYKQVIKPP